MRIYAALPVAVENSHALETVGDAMQLIPCHAASGCQHSAHAWAAHVWNLADGLNAPACVAHVWNLADGMNAHACVAHVWDLADGMNAHACAAHVWHLADGLNAPACVAHVWNLAEPLTPARSNPATLPP